jgi:hypothetical protein
MDVSWEVHVGDSKAWPWLAGVVFVAACGGSGGRPAESGPSGPGVVSHEPPAYSAQPSAPAGVTSPVQQAADYARWQTVTLDFAGPFASEGGVPNPFLDYRLDVTFTHAGRAVVVPGFFAADGNAADSSASAGDRWRVRFVPDAAGLWTYAVRFRAGPGVAVGAPGAGTPAAPDGARGSFTVGEREAPGMLRYADARYYRFAGSGAWFLKGGADSPENLLAFGDFDQTTATHAYAPHLGDWRPGDAQWGDGRGKGLVGALNYLASKHMNSVYFLTQNVGGDGDDVWPWIAKTERLRYDVSKLAQWERVFAHAEGLGILLHVVTQETETDQLLDGGALGRERKLYYRELVARFGHHALLQWNLGEENSNTDAERKAFAAYIRALDPYGHPIGVHTFPTEQQRVFTPLLGRADVDFASLQLDPITLVHPQTLAWVNASRDAGHPWVVMLDEIGPAYDGVVPDAENPAHDAVRAQALWGNLMAGGGGVEWYFGYQHANNDLNAEDWRSRDAMWTQTGIALGFFARYLPFAAMTPADGLTPLGADFVLAQPGRVYAIYFPPGAGTTSLDLTGQAGEYTIAWFNPRQGGALEPGTVARAQGGGAAALGAPPRDAGKDWVCLVTRR